MMPMGMAGAAPAKPKRPWFSMIMMTLGLIGVGVGGWMTFSNVGNSVSAATDLVKNADSFDSNVRLGSEGIIEVQEPDKVLIMAVGPNLVSVQSAGVARQTSQGSVAPFEEPTISVTGPDGQPVDVVAASEPVAMDRPEGDAISMGEFHATKAGKYIVKPAASADGKVVSVALKVGGYGIEESMDGIFGGMPQRGLGLSLLVAGMIMAISGFVGMTIKRAFGRSSIIANQYMGGGFGGGLGGPYSGIS